MHIEYVVLSKEECFGMKAKLLILCSAFLLASGGTYAAPAPVVYKCNTGGCEVHCKTEQGVWQLFEKAAVSVTTVNNDNGNVEVFVDDGTNGKRSLLVSPKNLLCRVVGYY